MDRIEHMFDGPDDCPPREVHLAGAVARGAGPVIEVVAGSGHDRQRWIERVLIPQAVEQLDEPPDAALAAAVEDVRDQLGQTADVDLLRLVVAAERLTSWLQAVQSDAIAELARRPSMNPNAREALDGRTLTILEIGAALGLTRHAATRRVDLSEQLAVRFPATLEALRDGRIDRSRAQVITDEIGAVPELPAADRALIEERALEVATTRTGPQLRDVIRHALQAVNPADAAERHQRQRQQRCVRTAPLPDGMGELWGLLPAETVTTIETVLNGLADSAANGPDRDARSHDQRRADVLGDIFATVLNGQPLPGMSTPNAPAPAADAVQPCCVPAPGAFTSGAAEPGGCSRDGESGCTGTSSGGTGTLGWLLPPSLPTRKGRRPHLIITIAASTLAGTDDQPATLAGYGPVPADLARRLASEAGTAQTACVDPRTGVCQWIGTVTPYRPTQAIADQVIARDPVCRHPGCRRPAAQCDIDHVVRHPAGPTCVCNLLPLCRTHHRCKHNGGWRVERSTSSRVPGTHGSDPPGAVIWTSPLGNRHTDPPVPLMPPAPERPERPAAIPAPLPIDPPF